jgi:DNA-binding MarR family transcriptional regulator
MSRDFATKSARPSRVVAAKRGSARAMPQGTSRVKTAADASVAKSGSRAKAAAEASVAKGSSQVEARADAKVLGDPGSPQFEIEASPFYLIARTAGRYAIDMENALRVIDMDLASWRALMLVHTVNPSSVSEITERAVMRLSTMTRVVQRLEKRGLVRLDTRKGDGRVTEVFITAAGEETVQKIRAIASRIYNIAFHDLSSAEIASLNALLSRVFRNLAIQPHP